MAGQGEANLQHLQMTEPGPSLASLGAGWLWGAGMLHAGICWVSQLLALGFSNFMAENKTASLLPHMALGTSAGWRVFTDFL